MEGLASPGAEAGEQPLAAETGPLSLSVERDLGQGELQLQQPELDQEITQLQEDSLNDSTACDDKFEDALEEVSGSPAQSPSPCGVDWLAGEKHIFVLSEAGKPIYSLGSDAGVESALEQLSSLGGIMQALASVVADSGDSIRSIRTSDTHIVFLSRPPLLLVCVSRLLLPPAHLSLQLSYIHSQIVAVLTSTQLEAIFKQRRNYDLRRLIGGSERLISSLSAGMDTDPSYFLSAVRCLALPSSVRDVISESIIRFCSKVPDMVFGILIAENQLVTLVRMKKYYIHPGDLHLVFNLINSSESFKHSESWTPLCLPKFDNSGFLHAHVSYLSDTCPACLVLLTADRNAFFSLSAAKAKVVERMERHGSIQAIVTALSNSAYTTGSLELGEMRHFVYKSRTAAQFTAPQFSPCYSSPGDQRRLYRLYLSLQNRLGAHSRPLKLTHLATSNETVLGWLTQAFELYAVFSPTTSKLAVITAVNKLLRWVKKEEDRLFILTAPTF